MVPKTILGMSTAHLSMNLGGKNEGFEPMTLAMTRQGHGHDFLEQYTYMKESTHCREYAFNMDKS